VPKSREYWTSHVINEKTSNRGTRHHPGSAPGQWRHRHGLGREQRRRGGVPGRRRRVGTHRQHCRPSGRDSDTGAPQPRSLGGQPAQPLAGLPDWSKAGYRGGQPLPDASDITTSASCLITPAQLASAYGVIPNDNKDDTNGIQAAIDYIKANCSPSASYTKLSLITFPAGVLNVSHEIEVDSNYTIFNGAGTDPSTGTSFNYAPDANTRYDALTPDGTDSDGDSMTSGDGTMGWAWPGTGLFRVSSRTVDPSYQSEYNAAPANRKEIFLGSINQHWKAGAKLRAKPGETAYAARQGDTTVYLATNAKMTNFKVGGFVNMMAANSVKFYQSMNAVSTTYPPVNLQMRQQIFTITGVDTTNHAVTIDKPLEYDMPIDSTSDGSAAIDGTVYASQASPIVEPVVGVGMENFFITQPMPNLNQAQSVQTRVRGDGFEEVVEPGSGWRPMENALQNVYNWSPGADRGGGRRRRGGQACDAAGVQI
jgi:hypothetical protein